MTVALVLATATACDGAARPSGSVAPGGQAAGRRRADPRSSRGHYRPMPPAAAGPSGTGPAATGRARPGGARPGGANPGGGPPPDAADLAACLPLPSLAGGQVTTQPLLTRICGQLCALGIRDIVLIAPAGGGDLLTVMAWDGLSLAGPGLAAAGSIDVIECASVAAELRAVATVTRRLSETGDAVLVCAGDLVAHTEALARLQCGTGTAALAAAKDSACAAVVPTGPDLAPALRLSGANGRRQGGRAMTTVVAAGSAFHRVHAPNAVGCGTFLVCADDGERMAAAADELAGLAAGQLADDLAATELAGDLATGPPGEPMAGPAAQLMPNPAKGRQAGQAGDRNGDLAVIEPTIEPAAKPAAEPAPGAADTAPPPEPRAATRHRSGFTDPVALLLVGLVRGGALVEAVDPGPLVCVRVQTARQARAAAAELNAVDEDRIRLNGAVKRGDGLFATCFVSPYSRYVARWAAHRRLTPNAVTGMSVALGALAAVWFSAGSKAETILGAALLVLAFVLGCVDGQLARYVRGRTLFGAWLDAVGGRLAEFGVYAGLAAGAAVSRSPTVWELALAALILLSLCDMIRFCSRPVTSRPAEAAVPLCLPLDEPADYAPSAAAAAEGAGAKKRPRARWLRLQARRVRRLVRAGLRWLVRIIEFRPGERVAAIAVTVIAAGPRMTFLVLLGWGLMAAFLAVITGIVRSLRALDAASMPVTAARNGTNAALSYRDDGMIAQALGRFVDGQLPPLLPAVAGVTVTIILCGVGGAHLPGTLVLAPVMAMALAGLGSGHPHDGRLDWLVPPLLQLGEYVFLTAVALAGRVPIPIVFVLIAVIALHHYDVVYRVRCGPAVGTALATRGRAPMTAPPDWIAKAGLGWEGRMLVAAFGAMLGAGVFAFAVLAVYLWVLFGWESVTGWAAIAQYEQSVQPAGFSAAPHAAARPANVEDGGSR
jgi:Family of unknown function (DUF5941)/CDP-alcohol phosphatidyltransferase